MTTRVVLAGLGSAIGGGLVVAMLGGATQGPKTIEAERIVLRSPDGSARVVMAARDDGSASVLFLDKKVKPRLTLALTKDGSPIVQLSDGMRSVLVGVDPEGNAAVGITDADGAERVSISENRREGGRVTVKGPEGQVIYQAPPRVGGRAG